MSAKPYLNKRSRTIEGDLMARPDIDPFALDMLRDRARPYGFDVVPFGTRPKELTEAKQQPSAEQKIQAAHDAVEDAKADVDVWRKRSAITAGGAVVGVALTLGGTLAMWFGQWLIAIPIILIGITCAVVCGIATCSRFATGAGVDAQKALRQAERRLRDALTASEDAV